MQWRIEGEEVECGISPVLAAVGGQRAPLNIVLDPTAFCYLCMSIRSNHRRQPRRGCRERIPTNILVGGDINGNVPTNIRGGSVVEYELLIASVKRKQR